MHDSNSVWYSIKRTINIGNYESMAVDIGESRNVPKDQQSEEVYQEIKKDVNVRLKKVIDTLKNELNKKV